MEIKPTFSFIGRTCVLLSLCALPCQDAFARHLQPDEALSMLASGPMKSASCAPLRLAYTQNIPGRSESAVYVFSRESAPGFYVLAADDAVGDIVLGYSDSSRFSADNMSPGMKWLLKTYSAKVSRCAASAAPSSPKGAPQGLQAVEPLLSTLWDQYEPYNDKCPVIKGERAVTGCVATAMAQVMKKHQWPASGTGSYSYVFNGISVSSDFSSHVYGWDNMLDDYYDQYYEPIGTPEQREAVAQLMFDCGVAAKMLYSSSGSSAKTIDGGAGMTKYFNYDKSMEYVLRGWYTDDDWMRLMHDQISQGLPVIYAGDSEEGYGHAFILDGYDGEGYFHFNWGWGGYDDGYFSISSDAAPGEDIGFVCNQEALVNIRPDMGSSYSPVMGVEGELCTTKTEYSYPQEYIEFSVKNEGGGFYSYALTPLVYELGVKNTLDGSVVSIGSVSLDPYYGFSSLSVNSRSFPVGEYDVYMVYRSGDTDWTPMLHFVGLSERLHFVNDGTTITVSEAEADITAANQAAYEAVMAEIEESAEEYEGVLNMLMVEYPDYDFSEWEAIIGGALEEAKKGAAQALAAANEDGEEFSFAFDSEYIEEMIYMMIEDVETSELRAANQAAYDEVIARIDDLTDKFMATVAQLKEENPDYDFSEWEAIIRGSLEDARTGAAQALAVANEEGEEFSFPFDGEYIEDMINEMIEDVKTSGIESIENAVAEGNATIYTLDGRKVDAPVRGAVNIIVTPTSTSKVYIRK